MKITPPAAEPNPAADLGTFPGDVRKRPLPGREQPWKYL